MDKTTSCHNDHAASHAELEPSGVRIVQCKLHIPGSNYATEERLLRNE